MALQRRDFIVGLASTSLAFGMATQAKAKTDWDAWADLLNWLPENSTMNAARQARGAAPVDYEVQKIENAKSEKVNFDFYAIDIKTLPPGMTDKQLFVHIRKNLNDFLDPAYSTVESYEDDDPADWGSIDTAPIGALMEFNIPFVLGTEEQAAVIASKADGRSWVFTPVTIGTFSPGEHPVSGNREFALLAKEGLAARIYTRGADRAVDSSTESFVYDGGDNLRRSFQRKVADFVVANGGDAAPGTYYFKRPYWADVVASGLFQR